MLKYFLERLLYDVGRAAVRSATGSQQRQSYVGGGLEERTDQARLVVKAIFYENEEDLAKLKVDLTKIDHSGNVNDDEWIEEWRLFVRHKLLPPLYKFGQDASMAALESVASDFLERLDKLAEGIRRNSSTPAS